MLQYSVLNIPYQKHAQHNHHLSDEATCHIYTIRLWWVGLFVRHKICVHC